MKNILLLFLIILFVSCNTSINKQEQAFKLSGILSEKFIDSLNIAESSNFKLEISQYIIDDSVSVYFKLFQKKDAKWKLCQDYDISKCCDIPLLTEIQDFNNDGFNDFTIHYSTAARGANDIRKLFIFDSKRNKYVMIKNSDDYPNLSYNKKLNCINALSVYGGTTTHFLRLENDSLSEFAHVDYFDGKVSSYKIINGKSVLLQEIDYNNEDDAMISFTNYDPIE